MFYFTDISLAHTVGRLASLEETLLKKDEVERMIDAVSPEEAFKVLNETRFSNYKMQVEKTDDYQRVLAEELLSVAKVLNELTPNNWVLNILWYYYDVHNLKTLYKARFENHTLDYVDSTLVKLGTLDPSDVSEGIFKDYMPFVLFEDSSDAKKLQKVLEKVEGSLKEKDFDSRMVEVSLDLLFINLAKGVAKKSGEEFLQNYVVRMIDFFNLQALVRIEEMGGDQELKELMLVSGGQVEKSDLLALTEEKLASFAGDFPYLELRDEVKMLFAGGFKVDLSKMSKLFQNALVGFVRSEANERFSLARVMSFFFAKLNNAQIVRTIMVGKLAGVEPEIIREHLRELY